MYRQFICLDKEHEGKLLSATPFLYSVIMRKLDKYKDANAIMAHLIITGKKTSGGKQDWNVVVLEVK
jgi:hypothetical protein